MNRPPEMPEANPPENTVTPPRVRPRVRFISTRPAWPLYPGYRLRTANLLRALCEMADVDATFVIPSDESADVCPPDVKPRSLQVIRVPRLSTGAALARWARGSLPMPMTKVDWSDAARSTTPSLTPQQCDLVFITPSTAWQVGAAAKVPVVIDLDDLDDFKIQHRLSDRSNYPSGVKGAAEQIIDRVDLRRWRSLYAEVKTTARCVVVCSETDRHRLGVVHTRALPNIYPDPQDHTGSRDTGDAGDAARAVHTGDAANESTRTANPSALLVGDLTYRPNLEALVFLEESVMPEIWKTHPEFEVNVVGKHDFGSRKFDARIHVHGMVESVAPFLRQTWMVVAPLRSGGGTRIKILEAFAHRVPVVATTVGYEGIPAVDGQDLLVADSPIAFAESMVKIAQDPMLAAALVDNGRRLFTSNFTFSALCASMFDVLEFALPPGGNFPRSS